nr:hypothetical protein [Tanacetum cinerariifolium]
TPQQNGIAKRKNITLIEAARTMLADSLLSIPFWAEAFNTACYVQNRVSLTKPQNKTPYELLHGRTPREDATQQYMLFLAWSTASSNPQNKEGDVAFDGKEHDAEKPKSAVNLSLSSSARLGRQDGMTKRKDKGKSHVEYFTGNRDFNVDFKDYSEDSSNNVSASGPIVPTAGQNYSNNTNPISVAGPSNTNTSPTHGKYSLQDASQPPEMLEKDDIAYSDHENVGAEANFNNFETSITVSPIPTTRTNNDHPVAQINGFKDFDYPDKVYKVVKALYGLHQAPRAWYETLANYLLENGFHRGQIHKTLFIKKQKGDILLVQMVKKKEDKIFISQDKYVAKILKKFGLTEGKLASTPIDTEKPLLKDPDGKDVDVHIYRSMIGSLMYLISSRPDIMFAQIVVATSSTEAKYVAGANCCAQVLWIQNQKLDYGKSDASEGFNQIIDFLNRSYIAYALTVNPTIYVSCIKQFWNTVAVKQSNNVTRLQALVDKKKVAVTEAAIKDALHLDDAEGVDCLPNEEIFTALAHMGYEKPSTKLTFYKAFLSSQWKVGKGCSGVETSLFEGMLVVREPEEQGDAEEQGSDDNAAEEPVTTVDDEALDTCAALTRRVKHLEHDKVAKNLDITKLKTRVKKLERANKGRMIDELDKDEGAVLMSENEEKEIEKVQDITVEVITTAKLITEVVAAVSETVSIAAVVPAAVTETVSTAAAVLIVTAAQVKVAQNLEITKLKTKVKKLERANKVKTLKLRRLRKVGTSQRIESSDDMIMEDVSNQGRMIDELDKDEGAVLMIEKEETKEVKDITGDAQVKGRQTEIYQINMDHAAKVLINVAPVVPTLTTAVVPTITTASVKVDVPSTRRKRGVVIRDPKEESSAKNPTKTKSKDKGKVGFRLDYFKGMSYDDIRPIFEAMFNSIIEFLLKSKEKMEEEENRAIASINETPA